MAALQQQQKKVEVKGILWFFFFFIFSLFASGKMVMVITKMNKKFKNYLKKLH